MSATTDTTRRMLAQAEHGRVHHVGEFSPGDRHGRSLCGTLVWVSPDHQPGTSVRGTMALSPSSCRRCQRLLNDGRPS